MGGFKHFSLAHAVAIFGGVAVATQIPLGGGSESQQAPLTDSVSVERPLVDSEALQATISSKNLLARAKELYNIAKLSEGEYNHPTRVIGSAGHLGTLSYIYSTLARLDGYYTVSNQTFPITTGDIYESRLVLGADAPFSATPMIMSPPTKNRQPVHGDVVLVKGDGCKASDYSADVKGNIAFVRRGSCSFGDKSALAGKAGAIAAVVYNSESYGFSGTLGTPLPDHVATFAISGQDAAPVLERLEDGSRVDGIAYIDAEVKIVPTNNIIAQTIEGDPENCVMLGGHSDSVAEGPGINDDGSGSLTLLELATQLTKFRVNNCVRFAWWSGEEEGLLGSDYYVAVLPKEENLKIRLFMDYDMLASPNFAYQVYDARNKYNPVGSEELRDLYVDWYKAHDLNYTFIPFDGRSDYDGFIKNGIPGGGIATGAEGVKSKEESAMFGGYAGRWYDPCYHQLCDDVSNVNLTAWELNSKVRETHRNAASSVFIIIYIYILTCESVPLQLVAHSVATFAVSFEGFPKRTDAQVDSVYEQSVKYHGPNLVM
jgi:aminopeptidase Y